MAVHHLCCLLYYFCLWDAFLILDDANWYIRTYIFFGVVSVSSTVLYSDDIHSSIVDGKRQNLQCYSGGIDLDCTDLLQIAVHGRTCLDIHLAARVLRRLSRPVQFDVGTISRFSLYRLPLAFPIFLQLDELGLQRRFVALFAVDGNSDIVREEVIEARRENVYRSWSHM